MSEFYSPIGHTDFHFSPDQGVYKGKVREIYTVGDRLISIASDRISAFDHILPRLIPYKGQVLNQVAAHFLEATRDLVPNWLESVPHPNVSIGKKCKPVKLEFVVRGYLAGHAWREYQSGKRMICGVHMPEGLKESDRFPQPPSLRAPRPNKDMMRIYPKNKPSPRVCAAWKNGLPWSGTPWPYSTAAPKWPPTRA